MNSLAQLFGSVCDRPPEPLDVYRARKAVEFAELRHELDARNATMRAERLRRECGLGERFESRTFTSWRQSPATAEAYAAATQAANDPKSRIGVWLYGPVGSGKSHLLAAAVNAALDANRPAYFATTVTLLDRFRASYDGAGEVRDGTTNLIAQCAEIDVLALDDLGKERLTPWSAERLWELVNRRYESGRGVLVSSNLDPTALAAHWSRRDIDASLGASIVRRLAEMAGAIIALGE